MKVFHTVSRWRRLLTLRLANPRSAAQSEWWRMPLIGILVSGPISFTTSLFLASYGAQGPYGGLWRLLGAGLAASVPIFALSGLLFAPMEIWLNRRPHRIRGRYAGILRGGALALIGTAGAFAGYAVVAWILPVAPPPALLPVFLVTYPLDAAIVGLVYTLYDEYVYQLRVSSQLRQEMHIARSIQQGLFPRQCPPVQGYSLAARCWPAQEIGGDFFDFMDLRDGRVGMVVADVSGKGMPAALLMANTLSIWRAEARLGADPADTLRRTNRALWPDLNANGFVTCLYGILDPRTHRICLASAGHPHPLLQNRSGVKEVEVYGLPLGLEPDSTYDEVQVSLAPGDTLLLYTDGLIEALNPARELFGLERLTAFLGRKGQRVAGMLVDQIWRAVCTFRGPAGQTDDITVIALQLHE